MQEQNWVIHVEYASIIGSATLTQRFSAIFPKTAVLKALSNRPQFTGHHRGLQALDVTHEFVQTDEKWYHFEVIKTRDGKTWFHACRASAILESEYKPSTKVTVTTAEYLRRFRSECE